MKSTNTFGVQFVARKTSASEDVQIYVRVTVNKRRAEISLKKTVNAAYWGNNAGRVL